MRLARPEAAGHGRRAAAGEREEEVEHPLPRLERRGARESALDRDAGAARATATTSGDVPAAHHGDALVRGRSAAVAETHSTCPSTPGGTRTRSGTGDAPSAGSTAPERGIRRDLVARTTAGSKRQRPSAREPRPNRARREPLGRVLQVAQETVVDPAQQAGP